MAASLSLSGRMGWVRIRRKGGRRHRSRREVPITPDVEEALLRQREAFIEKFGREPGPDDPVFFDPDADEPRELDLERYENDLAEAMTAAGIDPRLIYAALKTGLLVTEENLDKLPKGALEEWNAALDEYDERMKGEPS